MSGAVMAQLGRRCDVGGAGFFCRSESSKLMLFVINRDLCTPAIAALGHTRKAARLIFWSLFSSNFPWWFRWQFLVFFLVFLDICGRALQKVWVIVEKPKPSIAFVAEKPAKMASLMTMVHGQGVWLVSFGLPMRDSPNTRFGLFADGTDAILRLKHPRVLIESQTVDVPQGVFFAGLVICSFGQIRDAAIAAVAILEKNRSLWKRAAMVNPDSQVGRIAISLPIPSKVNISLRDFGRSGSGMPVSRNTSNSKSLTPWRGAPPQSERFFGIVGKPLVKFLLSWCHPKTIVQTGGGVK
jgi:hypothetical protein